MRNHTRLATKIDSPLPSLNAEAAAAPESPHSGRQGQVHRWCIAAFGDDHAKSIEQRGIRLAEEAIEAAQASGCQKDMLHRLVDHIYGRPVGKLHQELGGVGVTLLALAQAAGVDAETAEVREVDRILAKPLAHFTARDAAKNAAGFNVLTGTTPAEIRRPTLRVPGITLTGADEHTDVDALVRLLGEYPELEIGLLYSASPDGRQRYPTLPWLIETANRLSGRCAIHLCGQLARAQLLAGVLTELVTPATRVQVNGEVAHEQLWRLATRVPVLITQYNDRITDLSQPGGPSGHQLLVDASGGRGRGPASWRRPDTLKNVGFAGGLGADNLIAELARIREVALAGWWIDMEESLRTDDRFDLARCRAVLSAWRATA